MTHSLPHSLSFVTALRPPLWRSLWLLLATFAVPAVLQAQAEIAVTGNSQNIADGDSSPAAADHTDFGNVLTSGGTASRTFTITNSGNTTLTLGTVTLGGSSDFSVTAQPASSVAAGQSTTFTVQFAAAVAVGSLSGARSANLSFTTNDADESPFNFSIKGFAVYNLTPSTPLAVGAELGLTATLLQRPSQTAPDGSFIVSPLPSSPGLMYFTTTANPVVASTSYSIGQLSVLKFKATSAGTYTFGVAYALAPADGEDFGSPAGGNTYGITVGADTTPPTVTLSSTAANPTRLDVIPITITFSEAVTGFDINDLTVDGGSLSHFAGSGAVYTVDLTPDADGAITVNIAADAAIDTAGNGNTAATQFTITSDRTPPAVADITSTDADGFFKLGAPITLKVKFSEAVTVVAGGSPIHFALNASASAKAVYASGSGTDTLTFTYTPVLADSAADLEQINSLVLNGGTLRDAAGNDASLTLPAHNAAGSLATNKNLVVDAIYPAIFTIKRSDPAGQTLPQGTFNVTYAVTFTEAVTGVDEGDFTVTKTAGSGTNTAVVQGVSPQGNGVFAVYVGDLAPNTTIRLDLKSSGTGIQDPAGNVQTGGFTSGDTYIVPADGTAPLLSSTTPEDGATGVAVDASIVLEFTEVIVRGTGNIVLDAPDTADDVPIPVTDTTRVTIDFGTVTIKPSADLAPGVTYSVLVPATAFKDAAGNFFAGLGAGALDFTTVAPGLTALTTGTDTYTDTGATNDTITAATGTINAADAIAAGAGTDTLNATLANNETTGAAALTGFENLNVTVATGASATLDAQNIATSTIKPKGAGTHVITNAAVNIDGSGLAANGKVNVTFTSTTGTLTGGAANDSFTLTQPLTANVTVDGGGGSGDSVTAVVNGASSLAPGFSNVETITLNSTGTASSVVLSALPTIKTLTLAGGTNLTVNFSPSTTASLTSVAADSFTGNLTLTVTSSNATIQGGSGDDTLTATVANSQGNYTIHGGPGNDRIATSNGTDVMNGDDGDDTITSNGGADTLNGGNGNDSLDGGSANDTLNGGDGNDTLTGNSGTDTLTGGPGSDTFIADNGGDTITDFGAGDRIRVNSKTLSGVTAGDGTAVAVNAVEVGAYNSATNTTLLYLDNNSTADATRIQINLTGDYTSRIATSGGDVVYNELPPTLTAVGTLTGATEDTPLTITYATLAAAADEADPDGYPVSFRVEAVSSGTLTKNSVAVVPGVTLLATGESLVWQAAANANGTLDAFTVVAADPSATSTPAVQVQVTVAAVSDIPSTPVDSDSAANAVAEGASAGTAVGVSAASTDGDAGDTLTYSLTNTAGGRFKIDATTGIVSVDTASLLNFEDAAGHQITVRATDSTGANSTTQNFTIAVTNVPPSTPTDSDPAANAVTEGATNGSAVGVTAAATDINGGTVAFSLTDDAGGRFQINAATGVVTVKDTSLLNAANASSHSITVRADDAALAGSTQTFTITVIPLDSTAPTVVNVTSSKPDGTYATGETFALQVVFSEVVNVTGSPRLTLETGATDRAAAYAGGSGTTTLTFSYTVQDGDTSPDLNYVSTSSLILNGGTIKDTAGNAATLTLPGLAAAGALATNKALVVNPAPTIVSVTPPTAATYTTGGALNFTVNTSSPVTVVTTDGTPTLTLTIGTSRRFAYYVSGSGTAALVFRYAVQAGDNDANGIALTSTLTLNDGTIRNTALVDLETGFTAPDTTGVLVDTPPIVTAIRRLLPLTTATAASAVTWRVSFSEPVNGVDVADFTLVKTHGAYGVLTSVTAVGGTSGAEYDIAVASVSGSGTLRLDLKANGTGIADAGSTAIAGGFTAGQLYAPLTASFPVAWGRNVYGRLGDGSSTERNTPAAVKTDDQLAGQYLVDLAAGGYHSLGLTADGKVYAWGYNADGELGLGSTTNWLSPQSVKADGVLAGKTIVAIAAGGYHSLALDSAGKVYAWGKNDQGQLGNGSNTDSLVPVAVSISGALASKTVVAIAAGAEFSVALTADGRVYTWGDGGDGQLGHSDYVDYSNVPVAVATSGAFSGKTVIAIAAGSEHALALTTEGKVYAWGSNGLGQLGTNMFGTNRSTPTPVYHGGTYGTKTIVAIAAGWDHSIALTSEGRIYVWGENDHGQIGNNGTSNRNDPGLVSTAGVLAGKSIIAVTGGDSHTAALAADGRVYDWGFNDYGQLGNGTSDADTLLPVAVDTAGALAGKTVVALGTNWGGVFNLALAFSTTGPRILAVTPPAAQTYRAGAPLNFSVTFNNPVTVVTIGGTPKLTVTVGDATREAVYVSGSGTDTLIFRYRVQAGELDTDGVVLGSAIALGGGTIKDAAALDATLTLAAADTTGVVVDTRPALTALAPADNSTGISPATNLVLTFNEAVTVVSGKNLVIKNAANDSTVATIAVTDADRVTVDGTTVTVNPAVNLLYGTGYYVELDAGAFVNAATTGSAAITGATAWNFSTEVRSEVTAADSAEFAAYFANANVATIHLAAATTYTFPGGAVSRTLTIHGHGATLQAGAGVTDDVIRTGTAGGVTFSGLSDYLNKQVFLKITGALTLDHVTLQNNGADSATVGLFTVINVKNGGSIAADAITLEDFHNNPTPGTNLCFGIHAEPLANAVTLTNSTIAASNAFRNALAIRGGAVTVTGNTFHGTEHPGRLKNDDGYEYALYLYGGSGTVTGNTISGYDATTQPGYASAALSAIGFYNLSYTIENNTLTDNSLGIDVTRQWTGFTTPAPTVTVNGTALVTSADAYTIGEALRAANDENRVSVSLDQNDEVQLTPPSPASPYFAVLGGYRSPYLTVSGVAPTGATIEFPSTEADSLHAATTVALETQKDAETAWTEVPPTWSGAPSSIAVTFAGGHVHRYRAKLTHLSYVESGDPVQRTLVTYSAPVAIDAAAPQITSPLTAGGTYGTPFTYTIAGSKTPTSFTATGLPNGLSVNSSTGVISGSPTQTGRFEVSLTAGNAGGAGSPATLVLTIGKASLTVTADSVARSFGSANPTLTVSYSGFLVGDTVGSLAAAPTATTSANFGSPVGTYAINAAGGVSDHYTFTYVAGTLTITPASQVINFAGVGDLIIGQSVALSATATSGLPVSFSVVSGPATLSGSTLTAIGVGHVSVRASQAGGGNYSSAPVVERSFTVAAGSATVTTPTQVPAPPSGGSAALSVVGSNPNVVYQWQRNGADLNGATGPTLTLDNVQPPTAGLYTYTASVPGGGSGVSEPVIVGITTNEKVIGSAEQIGADIHHPNGNIYDQLLLEGPAATFTADGNQVTRISFLDLTDDIVQVEFSGAGVLSLVMDGASNPAPAAAYNQPGVNYVKGHAGIVITGADETTNISVVSVGRITAVNQALFRTDVSYDGVADIAFIAIQSRDGKFGGLRTGNANYFAAQGFTGVYAPGAAFTGPVNVGDVNAFDTAKPLLVLGSADTVRVAGGNLAQPNGQPVKVSGLDALQFTNGTTSQGDILPAQENQAVLEEDGVDVTDEIVHGP